MRQKCGSNTEKCGSNAKVTAYNNGLMLFADESRPKGRFLAFRYETWRMPIELYCIFKEDREIGGNVVFWITNGKISLMASYEAKGEETMNYGPDKTKLYPNDQIRTVCYIRNLPARPNVEIGDYTYYSDNTHSPELFYEHIQHHYEFLGDRLIIGKFCAIAEGITFIMNGANHRMDGLSTYPFNIFGGGWEKVQPTLDQLPFRGDTVIGNDVWLGQNVTVMPGVHIGNGAIVAANSTVVKDVEPYTIVGGNPARPIRKRFSDEMIALLQELKWWDWEEQHLFEHLEQIVSAKTPEAVRALMNKV